MKQNFDDISIVSATYLHDYVIRFVFTDGKVHDLDFHPFLSKMPQNPMVSKYLNLEKFKKFEIILDDEISWNNFEMSFSFFTLYYGFKNDIDLKKESGYYNAPVKRMSLPIPVKRKKTFV